MRAHTTILVLGVTLVVVGVLGLAMSAAFLDSPALCPGCTTNVGGSVTTRPAASSVDAMFIQQMIPHHDDAIAMAELALERSEHPELKQLAEDIIRTQSAENTQMREWYRDWFDTEVPDVALDGGMMGGGMMGGGMMGGQVSLDDLRAAEPFDKAFIEQMIPHHQMALMMSQMAGASDRPEMRGLAQSIVVAQSREIEQMREWYDEWYGR